VPKNRTPLGMMILMGESYGTVSNGDALAEKPIFPTAV